MHANLTDTSDRDDPVAQIPSCALDPVARREQQARYRQLAGAVTRIDPRPDRVIVTFDAHLDPALLERTLAVERECCPFFVFGADSAKRRLEISVRQPEQLPALALLAAAFAQAPPVTAHG